jgi:hypothetical protein
MAEAMVDGLPEATDLILSGMSSDWKKKISKLIAGSQ